jgi:hypothetical protein
MIASWSSFHVVLRHRAVVLDPLLGQEVGGVGLSAAGRLPCTSRFEGSC